MSCATTTIKYLVFLFNTLCALLGIGTIVVSSLALRDFQDDVKWVCILLIVLGSVVFTISFLGCCGAIRENVCLTWAYATFLLILVVANAVLMFGYIKTIDSETQARRVINEAWSLQVNGTDALSDFQEKFKCCGKNGPQDYVNANLTIPNSCYRYGNSTTKDDLYTLGCLDQLTDILELTEHVVIIFSWTTFAVECVALICAVILAISFRNKQRRLRY